ncbi:hypothetical protein LVY75_12465 [Sinorhizobium sp. B11]
MSNNNDAHRVYTDAITAQLGERVTNLGRRQTDLETEVRSGFKNIDTAVTSLANETRASIAALSTNLAERNKPQWQALGVALTFAAMLGGLAYLPIREATSDLKASVNILADKMVTQQELEWRTARSAEDRARTDAAVKDLRDAQVPREELDRVREALLACRNAPRSAAMLSRRRLPPLLRQDPLSHQEAKPPFQRHWFSLPDVV